MNKYKWIEYQEKAMTFLIMKEELKSLIKKHETKMI